MQRNFYIEVKYEDASTSVLIFYETLKELKDDIALCMARPGCVSLVCGQVKKDKRIEAWARFQEESIK